MKRAAIYTRVSTSDQHPEMQEEELVRYVKNRNWALCKTYGDKGVSGAKERRPGLDALLDDCRHRRIDVVVVWKFDRFARSLKQLVNALDLFRQLGVGFVSCTEAIDTSLPHGEMLFQVIGAIPNCRKSQSRVAACPPAGQATRSTSSAQIGSKRNCEAQERKKAGTRAVQRTRKELRDLSLDSTPFLWGEALKQLRCRLLILGD